MYIGDWSPSKSLQSTVLALLSCTHRATLPCRHRDYCIRYLYLSVPLTRNPTINTNQQIPSKHYTLYCTMYSVQSTVYVNPRIIQCTADQQPLPHQLQYQLDHISVSLFRPIILPRCLRVLWGKLQQLWRLSPGYLWNQLGTDSYVQYISCCICTRGFLFPHPNDFENTSMWLCWGDCELFFVM